MIRHRFQVLKRGLWILSNNSLFSIEMTLIVSVLKDSLHPSS